MKSILIYLALLSTITIATAWLTHNDSCDPKYTSGYNYKEEDTEKACSFARKLECDKKTKKCVCGAGISTKQKPKVWSAAAGDERVHYKKVKYRLSDGKKTKLLVDDIKGDCRVIAKNLCDPSHHPSYGDCAPGLLCLDKKTLKPIHVPTTGTFSAGTCLPGTAPPTPAPPPPKATPDDETLLSELELSPDDVMGRSAPAPHPPPPTAVAKPEVTFFCPDTLIFDNTTRRLILQQPFVVLINYDPLRQPGKVFRCTGVIYNSKWILTSYQCALPTIQRQQGNPTYKVGIVYYGEVILKIGDMSDLFRFVDQAVVPNETNTNQQNMFDNLDSNIALLELNARITFSKYTKVIKIAHEESVYTAGESSTFFGWQVTVESTTTINVAMRKLVVTLLTEQQSVRIFSEKFSTTYRFSAMTSKASEETTCSTDLGGGLVKIVLVDNHQAPVPTAEAILIGILPVTICHRTEMKVDITKVEYFSRVDKWHLWITTVAGPQDMDWRQFS